MKKLGTLVLLFTLFMACKEGSTETSESIEMVVEDVFLPINNEILAQAVIYEANIRQYSPEGTLNAFTADIPTLKKLGVKIIWLMPIHPISEVKRKAEGEKLVSEITDLEERKKYLGSPYAVADYTAVNPDMGTLDDFDNLVKTAHENGMYVILDWVPNHTGWDHAWITEHPDFYTKNEAGEITDPLQDDGTPWGWSDVADLNYDNTEMRKAMIDEMRFWITEHNVDGFRCDVAHGVPLDFWQESIPALRKEKDIFMLAEAELPEIMNNDLFEMSYSWEFHHLLNAIAKGEKTVGALDVYMATRATKWESDDILMQFVTNHDENAWAGPVKERMGDATEAMTALVYCVPGMPLVYSGQEYDMDYRLSFFGKDTIPKTKGSMYPILSKLGTLKNTLKALDGGKNPASAERIFTSNENVFAFRRVKDGQELIYVANLSKDPAAFTYPVLGNYIDAMKDQTIEIVAGEVHQFAPWQYLILTKP